eukprot:gb/GECG01007660.1/.p1 GENE.gb/GECG01007660.1/~~gb/GECG01007660.1/.p1  ORF type:complete len:1421 (+),score=145.96 gb/GECG01007660.1/:1-4263(+)
MKNSETTSHDMSNRNKQVNDQASRSVHFRTPLDTMSNRSERSSSQRQKRQRHDFVHSPKKRYNVDETLYQNFRTKLRPAVLPTSGTSQSSTRDGQSSHTATLKKLPEKAVNPLLHRLHNSEGVSRARNWESLVEVAQLNRFSYSSPTADHGEWVTFQRLLSKRKKLIREDILSLLSSLLQNPPPYQYAAPIVERGGNSLNYSYSWNHDENEVIAAEHESFASAVADWKVIKSMLNVVLQYTEFSEELFQLYVVDSPIQRFELSGLRGPLCNVISILVNLNIGMGHNDTEENKKSAVVPNMLQSLGTMLAVCHRNGTTDLLTMASNSGMNDQSDLVSVFLRFEGLRTRVLAAQSLEQLQYSYWSLKCANSGQPLVKEHLAWNAESRSAACLAILLSNFEMRHDDRKPLSKDHLTMLKDISIAEAAMLNPDNSIDNVRRKQKHRKIARSWGIDSNEGLVAALTLASCGEVGLMLLAEECCEHRDPAVVSAAATALTHLLVYNGLPLSRTYNNRKFATRAISSANVGNTTVRLFPSWEGSSVEVSPDTPHNIEFINSKCIARCTAIQAFIKQRERGGHNSNPSSVPGRSIAGEDSLFWNNDVVSEVTLNYWGARNLSQVNTLNSPRAKRIPQRSLQTNTSMLSRTVQSEIPTQNDDYESRIRSSLNRTVAGVGAEHPISVAQDTERGTAFSVSATRYERFSRRTFFDALGDSSSSPPVVLLANTSSALNVLTNLRERSSLSVSATTNSSSNSAIISGGSYMLLFQRILGLLSMKHTVIVRQTAVGLCDWPFAGIAVTLRDIEGPPSVSVAVTRLLNHVASAISHDNGFFRNTYSFGRDIYEGRESEAAITEFENWVRQVPNGSNHGISFYQGGVVCDLWREALRTGELAEQRLTGCITHRVLIMSLFKACIRFKENADTCNAVLRILRNLPPPILGGERLCNWLMSVVDSLLNSRFSTIRSCTISLCHQWLKFLFKLIACSDNSNAVSRVDDAEKMRWEGLQCSAIMPHLKKLLGIREKDIYSHAQYMWKALYGHLRLTLLECVQSGRADRMTSASCMLFCGQTGLRSVTKLAREQSTTANVRLVCIHAISSEVPLKALEIGGRLDLSQECASLMSSLTTDGNSRVRGAAIHALLRLYLRYSRASPDSHKISVLQYSSVVGSLTKRIDDEDSGVAETAAQLLSEFEPQGSVILLDILHRSKRPTTRAAAASGLSWCASSTSRPLILALTDRSEQVRNSVSLALLRKGPSKVQQELSEHSHEYLNSVICTIRYFETEYELSTTLKAMLRNIVSFFEQEKGEEEYQGTSGTSEILGELREEEPSLASSLHFVGEAEHPEDHRRWQNAVHSVSSPRSMPTQEQQQSQQTAQQAPGTTSMPDTQPHEQPSSSGSASRRRGDLYLPLDQIKQESRHHAVGEPISPGSV